MTAWMDVALTVLNTFKIIIYEGFLKLAVLPSAIVEMMTMVLSVRQYILKHRYV